MTLRTAVKRRLLINLALTALVGGLVILVMLEPGKEPPEPPPPLTGMKPEAVGRITIEQAGGPTIRLERGDGGWRMTKPRSLRASAGKIESLLGILGAESHRQYALADVDEAELGLAEPRTTLEVDDTRLVFGDTDPIEGRRYVRIGETVHLVGGRYLARLRNEPLYWADNALLPPEATITAIELPDLTLTQNDKGLWHAEPELEGVSADALVSLVDAWQHASALSVREAPETLPEDARRVAITLQGRDEPIVFRLSDMKTGFELIRPDLKLRYTMTAPQRKELLELTAPESTDGGSPEAAGDTPGN